MSALSALGIGLASTIPPFVLLYGLSLTDWHAPDLEARTIVSAAAQCDPVNAGFDPDCLAYDPNLYGDFVSRKFTVPPSPGVRNA